MAIAFSCECGKQLSAREQFAGRRMKCPECAKVLTIPQADQPPPAEATLADAPAPAQTVTPSEPDWLAAAVAEVSATAPEPRPTVAEAAHERDVVPAALARPAAKPSARDNCWQDRSLQQRSTPWREGDRELFQPGPEPRERSFGWFKIAALLLIVGGGLAASQAIPTIAERTAVWEARGDLDLVPLDSPALFSVRLSEVWRSSSDRPLRIALAARFARLIQDNLNISPEAIERVTLVAGPLPEVQAPMGFGGMKGGFGMPKPAGKGNRGGKKDGPDANKGAFGGKKGGLNPMPKGKPLRFPKPNELPAEQPDEADLFDVVSMQRHLLIVRTRADIDIPVLHARLDKSNGFRHKDRMVYLLRKSKMRGACLAVVNSKTAIVGPKMDIERALDDMDTPRTGSLTSAVARAQDKNVVFAIAVSRPLSQALPIPALMYYKRVVPPGAHGLLEVREAILTMHDDESGFAANARLTFADKDSADRMAQAIPAAFTADPGAWTRFVAWVPAHFRPLLARVAGSVASISTQQRDAELDISLKAANADRP